MTKKPIGSWSVRATALCLVTILLPFHALADSRICTKQEARAAETVAATAQSLEQLYRQFERYSHCDDGAIAEGFSEAVTWLLTERWQDVLRSYKRLKHDPAFRIFVIRHIDDTVQIERLNHIAENASKRCSENTKDFCRDIEMAAKFSSGALKNGAIVR